MSIRMGFQNYQTDIQKLSLQAPSKQTIKTKNETAQQSQQQSLEWSSQQNLYPKTSNIKTIEEKISRTKMAQENLQIKFQKVVKQLTNEIRLKVQANQSLQKQLNFLEECLNESRHDLQTIKKYLKQQQQKQGCKEKQKKTVNLNQTVCKNSKSNYVKQSFTYKASYLTGTSSKNSPPRLRLLKKQMIG